MKQPQIMSDGVGPWLVSAQKLRSLAHMGNVVGDRLVWPWLDLFTRFWIAKLFFGFGMQHLVHWATAVQVANDQNPLPLFAPLVSTYLDTSIYLIGGALLALGFMTRYAALALLVLAVVAQVHLEAFDTQLFWVALFGWYAVHGAGPVSLDQLLRAGLADSAVPFIPRAIAVSRWLRAAVTPWYLTALRIWLGATLTISALRWNSVVIGAGLDRWLPLDVAMRVSSVAALLGGLALMAGGGARYVALVLLAGLFAYSMVDPRLSDSVYLLMILSLIVVKGSGRFALDRWASRVLDGLLGARLGGATDRPLPRVVIIGAGFGGLRCAQGLRYVGAEVTLIDRTNFHLFQPLLYQVATAALSPGDIAIPTRPMFRDAPSTRLLLGSVTGIDVEKRLVRTERSEVPYDYLVLATGATHSYFGKDLWMNHAPGLKQIEDALDIRRRILTAFERAEETVDPKEKSALLTFLIVGGGPTGVELAGAIAELARFGLNQDFRTFDPRDSRVILVQAAPRLLPAFPQRLSEIAKRELEKLRVEVRLQSRVRDIDSTGVMVNDEHIAARTVLWAAGVTASPAAAWLNAPCDGAGRILVDDCLRVPGRPNVFAIGDTALSHAWKGQPVPGLAPAAKQGGAYVARQIRAHIGARPALPAFRYRHLGSLATIGRKAAVADFGRLKLWGAPAWWLWGFIHIGFMLGMRNRVATLLNWFWCYLRFAGSIRLITGKEA